MSKIMPFNDLTDLINQAQRGLKRDVEPLIEALAEGGFFVSLARSLGLADEMTLPTPEQSISSHMIKHPDGSIYVTMFTRPEFVQTAQKEADWKSDADKAEICPIPARNAIYYAGKLIADNEQVVGLFINPYQEKSLMLNIVEIESLFNGVPVPFENYAQTVPFEEEDSIMVRPADVTGVEGFSETVSVYQEQQEGVNGYEVVALFDEQRNMEPYLAINFQTEFGSEQYPEAAQKFVDLLKEKVDFPERLEIMFNEKFPTLI